MKESIEKYYNWNEWVMLHGWKWANDEFMKLL